ncbi:helix-turn-helix domain-containing protein (plasmid) [Roseomonas marmotae]|uniref:Helix-turn-helix domain-containing protein n=1 Tax=Roseomonas marmotae TaxID=2768161 RepID=A0ABS3KIV1_9PROT|nr:helix-turn-helix domain-containing protein [Roseomonas marmotae]QTI82090.1 helix-turn-helix domain-containing protein [Roseomonas marmotae]QTI82141.1 helix-turn-helix domain-containing protein [Roseomonas marmotae]
MLEAFGRQPHPMSLSQRAEVPGLDKSSAQGVSYTLTRLGCIERDDGVRYFIPAN